MSQLKTIHDGNAPPWLPRLAGNQGPRFLQIADALQAAVADGSLKPGDRLPPQRRLATQLDVDLRTVTRAYDEGVAVTPAEAFATTGASVDAIRISLGSIKERGRLQAGLQRLSRLLARRPAPLGATVV